VEIAENFPFRSIVEKAGFDVGVLPEIRGGDPGV